MAVEFRVMSENVVESDQPAGTNQFPVTLVIVSNPVEGVVSVDEEEIDLTPVKDFLKFLKRLWSVRIATDEMYSLTRLRIAF